MKKIKYAYFKFFRISWKKIDKKNQVSNMKGKEFLRFISQISFM